jgi:hypothetical protein
MKKIFLILILVVSNSFAADLGKNFQMANPSLQELQNKTIMLSPGITMNAGNYIIQTSFKVAPKIKQVFTPNFQQQFLLKKPEYTEKIESKNDRLIVERTLVLKFKDPCDPKLLNSGLPNLCFKKKNKHYTEKQKSDFHIEMNKIRNKAKQLKPNDPETIKITNMSDEELIDYLLNKRTKTKKIIQKSIIPLVVYQDIKNLKPLDLQKPNFILPKTGIFTSYKKNSNNFVIANNKNIPNSKYNPNLQQNNTNKSKKNIKNSRPEMTFKDFLAENQPDIKDITFNTHKESKFNILFGETIGRHYGDSFTEVFAEEGWFTDKYYAMFYYSFGLGYGLRWPFEIDISSDITDVAVASGALMPYPQKALCKRVKDESNAIQCAAKANVKIKAKGINASPSFYRNIGVSTDKIFEGKEFVFEAKAEMGLYISIPGPNISYKENYGFDFNKDYTPPLGNQKEKIIDFLLYPNQTGLKITGSIGVADVYAGLNIGAFVTAQNSLLMFVPALTEATFENEHCEPIIKISSANHTMDCNIIENTFAGGATPRKWGIGLSTPSYATDFILTPQLGIRIGVWVLGYDWNTDIGPYAIPNLSIDMGRFSFTTHEGTNNYYFYEIAKRFK